MPATHAVPLPDTAVHRHAVEEEKKEDDVSSSMLKGAKECPLMDDTLSTLSLSTDEEDEEKEEPVQRETRRVLVEPPQPSNSSRAAASSLKDSARPSFRLLNSRTLADESDTENEEEDDDEDEEEYDHLVQLDFRLEMEEHARTEALPVPPAPSCQSLPTELACVTPTDETTLQVRPARSMLESVAEVWVDTLCLPRKVCGSGSSTSLAATPMLYEEDTLHQDILHVMGCNRPPDEDEMAQLWDIDTAWACSTLASHESPRRLPLESQRTGPQRPSRRERVRRWRQWRRPAVAVGRTYSMDETALPAMAEKHHNNNDDDDLTYDSDPEVVAAVRPRTTTVPAPCTTPQRARPTTQWKVRESMNESWDLVWHREEKRTATPARAWMERGTLVGGHMLEPALVIRQSGCEAKQATEQLRFLNICRILPASAAQLQEAALLARPSCTIRLLTSTGHNYWLETSSPAQRQEVLEAWKIVISRFATLAVLEDLETIQRDFFHPLSHSYVPDVEDYLAEMERDAEGGI
jgi:hypothetical protein